MDKQTVKLIFDTLYSDVNGYELSRQGREKLPYQDKALTYGEVTPETFDHILQQVQPAEGELFYDLGCGTGKAVLLAHLYYDFAESHGIELLSELSNTGNSILARYDKEFKHTLSEKKQTQNLSIEQGDFLTTDISKANIVFAHSTCFYDEFMMQLDRKLQTLQSGARVITVSKPLYSESFKLLDSESEHMAWGKATVFYYKRV
ncbi:MAG: hypothetical protein WCO06_06145 [Candidatus Roizmanbacteria bacterium]